MLKRSPSLALRAALIFFAVCATIFIVVLGLIAVAGPGSAAGTLRSYWDEGVLVVLLWIAILALILTAVAVPLLTRAVKPIVVEAARIGGDDPQRRLDESKAPRELLPMVRGFNAALDRLSDELVRRKRFVADVAHELRTPLAILMLRVDAIGDDRAKDELRRGVQRLSDMVAQMLEVERLTLGKRDCSIVDLTALARDVVADMAPMAMAAGYEISLEAPDAAVPVEGDAGAIERAIVNLVGNAVAHGGGRGRIKVIVGAPASVDVSDEGPGVPAAVQPNLFEPFCRDRWDSDGCGLGLHLTREIMRAHGGEAVHVPGDSGARFRLAFPRAS
jgi:two-component system OmpR family sensor kinase